MSQPTVTLAALLFGDYFDLHRRCLTSFLATIPRDTPVRLGLNQVGTRTMDSLPRWFSRHDGDVEYFSAGKDNIKKYPMMRRMLADRPLYTDWVIWADDDTWINEPSSAWFSVMADCLRQPRACYIGETWWIPYMTGQTDFIKTRSWYTGVPFETHKGQPGVHFNTGGFVAVHTDLLLDLDWPDRALLHNGGDVLLGEAVRQKGRERIAFPTKHCGVMVNNASRRGYSERPVGARG